MKPIEIKKVLNVARQARRNGDIFNPLFVSNPGLGKSSIVQQWCEENNLPFIDLRAAYLEAPDVIGFPSISIKDGRQITTHNVPEFWPSEGEGVILLEEPNRGTTSIMNTFMQLLTDRRIHNYNLPEGWMIVGCINPENGMYEVNNMDAALKNRFEIFEVEYDKPSFLEYAISKKWDESIVLFIDSGVWSYVSPEKTADDKHAKYNSPRTFSKLNAALKAGIDKNDELMFFQSILGSSIGQTYYAFRHKEQPVTFKDIKADPKYALKRLEKFGDPTNYRQGHISIAVKSIIEDGSIEDNLLYKVLMVLPVDQGIILARELEFKRGEVGLLQKLCDKNSDLNKYMKNTFKK